MTTDLVYRVRFVALLAALAVGTIPALAEDPPAAPAKSIAAALQPFVDSHSLAGAVTLVADKDKVLSLEAVGFADIAANKPMRTDSLFWIASQSKPITAAAPDDARGRGQGETRRPGGKISAGVQGPVAGGRAATGDHMLLKKPKHPITVRDILSHTSGLPFNSAMETADARPAAAARRGAELCHDAAAVRAGQPLPVFQRRHQHGRPHHRSRQRHALRGVSEQAAVRAARHEGHDLLAQRGAAHTAGEIVPAQRGQDRPGRD